MTSIGNKALQPEELGHTTHAFIYPPSNRVCWPHNRVGLAGPAQNKRTGKRTRVHILVVPGSAVRQEVELPNLAENSHSDVKP
jgi:hypothetical protein